RDLVQRSLDTMSDWRLTRPTDVPGQSIDQADYVLIAEIVEVERWEQQATEHIQRLADDLAHLVSSRGMLVVRPVFCASDRGGTRQARRSTNESEATPTSPSSSTASTTASKPTRSCGRCTHPTSARARGTWPSSSPSTGEARPATAHG